MLNIIDQNPTLAIGCRDRIRDRAGLAAAVAADSARGGADPRSGWSAMPPTQVSHALCFDRQSVRISCCRREAPCGNSPRVVARCGRDAAAGRGRDHLAILLPRRSPFLSKVRRGFRVQYRPAGHAPPTLSVGRRLGGYSDSVRDGASLRRMGYGLALSQLRRPPEGADFDNNFRTSPRVVSRRRPRPLRACQGTPFVVSRPQRLGPLPVGRERPRAAASVRR